MKILFSMSLRLTNVLLFILVLSVGCDSNKIEDQREQYALDFTNFYDNINPGVSINNDDITYYIIYNGSCESCIVRNLTMLSEIGSNTKKVVPVMVGPSPSLDVKSLYNLFIEPYYKESFFLSEYNLKQYSFDLSKPLLLEFKSGKLVYFKNFDDFELDEARNKLLKI